MSDNPFLNQSPIAGVKNVILVGSGKGGVGKSTVAVNLALSLKAIGHQVGILDADIYGPSIPRMVGALNQPPELDKSQKIYPISRYGIQLMSIGFLVDESQPIVWRGPMLFKAMDQFLRDVLWKDLDYLIVDLPPGTGDVALTLAQKVPVQGAIVVTTPQNLSLVDAKKAIGMFQQVNIPLLGVIENMSGFRSSPEQEPVPLFPKGELDPYLKSQNIAKLACLEFHPSVSLGSEAGIPLVQSEPNNLVSQQFKAVAQKIAELVPVKA